LDDYYDQNRRSYYEALKGVDQSTLNLTPWLEYFTEGVAISIKAVRDKVLALSRDIKILKERGQIALTERQMKIVEFIIQNGEITNRNVRKMFRISDRAALKEIRKLVDLEVIKPKGKGRSLYYILV
jgi:predicted HTH transcriptional regulator